MLKLACNYSDHLLQFLPASIIKLDYIKLSRADVLATEMAKARQYCPALLHHLPSLGLQADFWQTFNYRELNQAATQAATPFLSIHFDAYTREIGVLNPDDLFSLLVQNYRQLQKQISLPLLIENCDRYPYFGENKIDDTRYEVISQPAFITRFIETVHAPLLLDLAHAQCAADFYQLPVRTYLNQLPLDQVREIHLSGSRRLNGLLRDTHYALEDQDYDLLQWTLNHCRPEIVTLEYGGTGETYIQPEHEKNDPHVLLIQLQRLSQIIAVNNQPSPSH
jgi:uncharacterized protein (UPF0276 family)